MSSAFGQITNCVKGAYMNVCILIKETQNNDEYSGTTIVGVYSNRTKAEKELIRLAKEDSELVGKLGCDPSFFAIEERPVL